MFEVRSLDKSGNVVMTVMLGMYLSVEDINKSEARKSYLHLKNGLKQVWQTSNVKGQVKDFRKRRNINE